LYGVFRFAIEFFRAPDVQIGYLAFGWLTEGQVLSFPMIIAGMLMMLWAERSRKTCNSI
jgi:phosphatidylglycerol:prolipoprotein diacylglycerol transferase